MIKTLSTQQKLYSIELLKRFNTRLYYALCHHRNTRREKMDFTNRKWLLEIYNCDDKDMVIMKSVQCGISEWLICETLSKCEKGLSVFYVLPKYNLRNVFVANRIDRLFSMVPYYKDKLKRSSGEADSKEIKHYGTGSIKFASSNTEADFIEFPADIGVIDEVDRCDQRNIQMLEDRISASKYKQTRKVSNPTVSGYGIAELYKKSDQRTWKVRCDGCGDYYEIDFFKSVCREVSEGVYELLDKAWTEDSQEDIKVYCQGCGAEIDRLTEDGKWEPKRKSRVTGYQISKLFDPNTTIVELWQAWQDAQGNETKKQVFYNSDLGLPYESTGAKLTEALLDKCVDDYVMPSTAAGAVMGADVGAVLNVSIAVIEDGKRKKVFIGTVLTFEEIDNLIAQYGVECCVIDALPETRKAKELRDRNPGRVWLCEYHGREGSTGEMKVNEDEHRVSVDRTQSLDESHQDIIKQQVIYPKNAKSLDRGEFYEQMKAPTRLYDSEKNRFLWVEGANPDHYRHADNYEKIAAKLILETGAKVWFL